jgi:hypothetical protein
VQGVVGGGATSTVIGSGGAEETATGGQTIGVTVGASAIEKVETGGSVSGVTVPSGATLQPSARRSAAAGRRYFPGGVANVRRPSAAANNDLPLGAWPAPPSSAQAVSRSSAANTLATPPSRLPPPSSAPAFRSYPARRPVRSCPAAGRWCLRRRSRSSPPSTAAARCRPGERERQRHRRPSPLRIAAP